MTSNKLINIKTFKATKEECGCIICGIYYKKGNHVSPFPKCDSGNITMFDITQDYVRFTTFWPNVGHTTTNNWEEVILNQIKTIGKPIHVLNNPNQNKVENFIISFEY